MATVIVSNVVQLSDFTGGPNQSHLIFARTQSKWWYFYAATKTATTISCLFSSSADLSTATWSAGTASPAFPSSHAMSANDQRNIGCLYGNNGTTDYVHVSVGIGASGATGFVEHIRAAFSGASTITWDTWTETATAGTTSWTALKANAVGISTTGFIHEGARTLNTTPAAYARRSSNADTGSSWTDTWGAGTTAIDSAGSSSANSYSMCQIAAAAMLAVYDSGQTATTATGIRFQKYASGTTWPSTGAADVITGATSQDKNDWCAISLGPSSQGVSFNCYLFRRNSNTAIQASVYTSSWASTTNAVPSYNVGSSVIKAGAGIFAATDGWSIWLFVMDNTANNAIYYIKGSNAQGTITWGSWTLLEAAGSTVRTGLSGCPYVENNQINVLFAQVNGSNFDAAVSTLTVCSFAIVQCVNANNGNTGAGITSLASTWLKPTTAGNLLLRATQFAYASVAPTSFSFPTGFSAFGSYLSSGSTTGQQVEIATNAAIQAVAAQTTSWTNGSACVSQVMLEVAGVIAAGTQDGSTQTSTGTGTSLAGGALTTTNANDAVMAFLGQGGTGTSTSILSSPTGGFSLPTNGTTNVASGITPKGNASIAILYQFVSATGTYTPGMTGGISETWEGATAGFWACGSVAPGGNLFRAANLVTGAGGPFFVCPCN